MKKITLTSGNVLEFGDVPFDTCQRLFSAIQGELEKRNLDMKIDDILGMELLNMMQTDGFGFLKLVSGLATSEDVLSVVWEAGARCIYKRNRVSPETFEDKNARKDYFEIIFHICKEVCLDFFPTPLSSSTDQKVEDGKL